MMRRRIESARPDHPAVAAWSRLGATEGRAASAVETLQKRRKGRVYRLVGAGASGSDVVAKWSSWDRIRREAVAYEEVLPRLRLGSVRYYGTLAEPDPGGSWLFVAAAGAERYAPRLPEHRALAARWLAALHGACWPGPPVTRLPDRGTAYYRARLASAGEQIRRHLGHPRLEASDAALLAAILGQCDVLASRWDEVAELCSLTPPTVVHGDFAPKNMGVDRKGGALRLQPFDWANAGWGVAAADLAQLDRAPTDYWANPDLDVYFSAMSRQWPRVRRRDVDLLAHVGKVCRTLVCLDLEAAGLATDWPEAALRDMRYYHADLDDALRGVGWHA
jgi:hypothetical protein